MINKRSELEKFIKFSNEIGKRNDYVQGGGGNTSFKPDAERMIIKASGYFLSQVKEDDGYVVLSYPEIEHFFYSEEAGLAKDIESIGSQKVRSAIIDGETLPRLRPSVEAGFHSLLSAWVAHTHSVYINIILCSKSAKELLTDIFYDIDYMYIPYVNPGSRLTLEIVNEINKHLNNHPEVPEIIFLENHGVIVHAEDMQKCLSLHQEVNARICKYFSLSESEYPLANVKEINQDVYISDTDYLINVLKTEEFTSETLLSNPLYPDQMVYLADTLDTTAFIDHKSGKTTYHMPYKQALLLEQIITAIIFIMKNIKSNNLEIQFMSKADQEFIKKWESESYRKKISKE
ncbi:MAG: class II aldolase/adducin family protein [Saccharofermentanales bacterium]|jgi:ribulose-5-phosphate 4-epimerase/fuculose-1-phosphate aldolase